MTPSSLHNDNPGDEMLIAYADGQLQGEARDRVERYLQSNPEAQAFVEALKQSAALTRDAFDEAMAPPPRALVDAVQKLASAADRRRGNVYDFRSYAKGRGQVAKYALPLAACLALVMGGYVGLRSYLGGGPGQAFDVAVGPVKSGSLLEQLLETKTSGDPLPVSEGAGEAELVVVATFKDGANRACREFEATHPEEAGTPLTVAVACRMENGQWIVEGAARVAAAPGPPVKDFSPAAGSESAAIDGILAKIGARPALPASEEQALLARKWK